jgi:hypothetical protein
MALVCLLSPLTLREQTVVSINVGRLAGDTVNITCNFLYCNHQVHRLFYHPVSLNQKPDDWVAAELFIEVLMFLGTNVPCTFGWPYTEGTWLYSDCITWCVSCTALVLTCFLMSGCVCVCLCVGSYDNCVGGLLKCVLVYSVFCSVCTVFVLFVYAKLFLFCLH